MGDTVQPVHCIEETQSKDQLKVFCSESYINLHFRVDQDSVDSGPRCLSRETESGSVDDLLGRIRRWRDKEFTGECHLTSDTP